MESRRVRVSGGRVCVWSGSCNRKGSESYRIGIEVDWEKAEVCGEALVDWWKGTKENIRSEE